MKVSPGSLKASSHNIDAHDAVPALASGLAKIQRAPDCGTGDN